MNEINAQVTKVLSKPKFNKETGNHGTAEWWSIKVECVDMGGYQEKELTFKTKEEAEKVEEGYKFKH